MTEAEWLTANFEENRPRLHAIAHRILGSPTDADDAVQEVWLRLHRSDTAAVENLGGWLTTVVARICLDMLRARRSRGERPAELELLDSAINTERVDPAEEAERADSVGMALLIVLETLRPSERLAYVLHDMFGVRFDEIGPIIGREPATARQLASRARRRVRETDAPPSGDARRRRDVVAAFLAASREGRFDALLELLDPDVTLESDAAALLTGSPSNQVGRQAVAETFVGRAKAARFALLAGEPGLVWAQGSTPKVAFTFTLSQDLITGIEIVADTNRLDSLDIELL